jgi:hypothetical protein
MTRSILLGGIVGVAIGALITLAIAHGVFELTARAQTSESPKILSPGDAADETLPARVSHRPLRPGSRARGSLDRPSQS